MARGASSGQRRSGALEGEYEISTLTLEVDCVRICAAAVLQVAEKAMQSASIRTYKNLC